MPLQYEYMIIAVLSDSHDHWVNMKNAVEIANSEGCEVLLHAGDLIAPPGIEVLKQFKGKVYFVWGNNEGERVGITRQMDASENITLAGNVLECEIESIKVFMNHYPNIGRMAYESNKYNLIVYGHDHTFNTESKDNSVLLNPGEICGYRSGVATFAIFDTDTKAVKKIEL